MSNNGKSRKGQSTKEAHTHNLVHLQNPFHSKKTESLALVPHRASDSTMEVRQEHRVSLDQQTNTPYTSSLDGSASASAPSIHSEAAIGEWDAEYRDQVAYGEQINGLKVEGLLPMGVPDTTKVLWEGNTVADNSSGIQVNGQH